MSARFNFLMAVILLVALSACHRNSKYATDMFGSVENLKFIQTAPVVKAVRLQAPFDMEKHRPAYGKMRDLANYSMSTPVEMTPKQIATLRAILSDASIDDPDSRKGCIPDYGVRFTFSNGKRTIDVNLCYQCDLISTTEAEKYLGGGDFDRAHEKLTFLARAIFPDDKDIQLIPVSRDR